MAHVARGVSEYVRVQRKREGQCRRGTVGGGARVRARACATRAARLPRTCFRKVALLHPLGARTASACELKARATRRLLLPWW